MPNKQTEVNIMLHNATPQVAIKSQQGKRGDANDDHATWFAVDRPDRQCVVHIGVVADGVTSTAGIGCVVVAESMVVGVVEVAGGSAEDEHDVANATPMRMAATRTPK